MALRDRHCVPCRRGDAALSDAAATRLAQEVPRWRIEDKQLRRRFEFADFAAAMGFLNQLAAVAEAEGHHPDFAVHYNRVDVAIWTHAIGGLSENDFILAAKLDAL